MHDISLYGHLTVDKIFDGFEERQTLGAMANMWRTFKQISPELDIGMIPTSVGEAIVYIDRESSTRYSNFVPDIKTNFPMLPHCLINFPRDSSKRDYYSLAQKVNTLAPNFLRFLQALQDFYMFSYVFT